MQFADDRAVGVLEASDVSGQRRITASDVPSDTTVGELVDELLTSLRLNHEDGDGRPIAYRARLEREGRHLHASELVGDALREGDELVLHPNIDAGGAHGGHRSSCRHRQFLGRTLRRESTSA